jgi:hypothetical protein
MESLGSLPQPLPRICDNARFVAMGTLSFVETHEFRRGDPKSRRLADR